MARYYRSENLVDEAVHKGVCEVMNKPIDLDRLISLIESLDGKAGIITGKDAAIC